MTAPFEQALPRIDTQTQMRHLADSVVLTTARQNSCDNGKLTSRSRESPDPSAATEAGVLAAAAAAAVSPAREDLATDPGCTSWAEMLLLC